MINSKQIIKGKTDIFSVIAVGFLVAVTAGSYFYEHISMIMIGTAIYGFIFFKRGLRIQKEFYKILLFIVFILFGQILTANKIHFLTFMGVLLRFFLAYFILRLLKTDFFVALLKFVYLFAIISLIFYIPTNFFPDLKDFLVNHISPYVKPPFANTNELREQIILYDFSNFEMIRYRFFRLNSGFYWEPGAHAIFLNIALMISFFLDKKIFSKRNIVLIFTILTTFSTTGYLALFFNIGIYLVFISGQKIIGLVVFIPALILFYYIYINLGFLSEKIDENIAMATEERIVGSRFQSFLLDFNTFKEYPFFGKDRYAGIDEPQNSLRRNNGIGVLLATYGIFAFILYFFGVYKGIKIFVIRNNIQKEFIVCFFLLFILLNFGMPLLLRPLFYAMAILPIVNRLKSYPLITNTFNKKPDQNIHEIN